MLQNISLSIFKKPFGLFLILIFFSLLSFAQDGNDPVKTEEEIKIISFGQISEESERISLRLYDFRNVLVPSYSVRKVDSLLNIGNRELIKKKDSLVSEFNEITRRNLAVRKIEWNSHRSRLKSYQNDLNDRSKVIVDINIELISEIRIWEETKEAFSASSDNKEVYDNLDKIISALNDVFGIATDRLEKIYVVEKKLTELVLFTDELIAEIETKESGFRKDYFVFDSDPIWTAKDSVSVSNLNIDKNQEKENIRTQFSSNLLQIQEFISFNAKTVAFQIIFILLLFFLLLVVKNKWKINLKQISNPVDIQAKIILKHYIAATVVVGFLISAFFYEALTPIISEFHILLVFSGTIVLLPKLTSQKFSLFLICIFGLYITSIISSYIDEQSFLFRIILLVEITVLFFGLVIGRRVMNSNSAMFGRMDKPFSIVTPIYLFFLLAAFVADIIGMVALSGFLFRGVLESIILLLIINSSVKIIASIFVLIFKLRKSYGLNAVSTIVHATHKRIQPALFWFGMIVWLFYTFKGFDILDVFTNWLNQLLENNWEVGEMNISLGGILSFTGIFIFTILLAKLVASILQDEWMFNIIPKGIAPAISLMLRILIITIGFYIGLSAAGLDLSKLGFVVGALGVGIGFGLQNVVLNFIAGLILAFERPINLGDTIEVDNEFGVVTNIGVRSSNIKTYAGYEAIIPNGDLISKKVINWTLSNRDRRTQILLKTAANAEPNKVIDLFNSIASNHATTYDTPAPFTYFKGYGEDGNLKFELWYWTTFSDALKTNHEISLTIFDRLKDEGIEAPIPARRIIKE